MEVTKEVTSKFADFVFDEDYETYLALGGYGSGKSYHVALKIVLICLREKTKVLVVREVYGTLFESCYDLIREILEDLQLLADEHDVRSYKFKVVKRKSPMEFKFPNGSRIIFRGMDKPEKVKSINDVAVVWLEECSEIKYDGYKEILGRVRTPTAKMMFLLSCNPVGKENWVYRHFFAMLTEDGHEIIKVNDEELYEKGTLVHGRVYMHHSLPDDNPFLPKGYLQRLDDIRTYDPTLWRVARWGRFGAAGLRVLPQFQVAKDPKAFVEKVRSLPRGQHYYGMDFGFEESYNAVVSMAVDKEEQVLYIYDEIYMNKMTDPEFAELDKMMELKAKDVKIVADNEDPKAIRYYQQCGFNMRGCRNKFAGSRMSNTRKIKRFKKIICSPKCINTIRELKDLTYKKDAKGNLVYDDFNIDPHTFSAIWYALDTVTVADVKEEKRHSVRGE